MKFWLKLAKKKTQEEHMREQMNKNMVANPDVQIKMEKLKELQDLQKQLQQTSNIKMP